MSSLTRLREPASKPVTILEGSDEMRGALPCPFLERLDLIGGAEVAMAAIEGRPRLTGVFRDILSQPRIPDYEAQGVLRVSHCAPNGMVSVSWEHRGMSRPSAAKLVQDSVNGARKAARTARPGR